MFSLNLFEIFKENDYLLIYILKLYLIMVEILLRNIAYARSGDKGSNSNIGVIAYTPQGYRFLQEFLTPSKVSTFFAPLGVKSVQRYELPNIEAFNFILEGVLAGGGSLSLRIDAQGKALGQALLQMPIDAVDPKLLSQMLPKEDEGEGSL